MLLIEADGKALFADAGIRIPRAQFLTAPAEPTGSGPWIVKAQVPVGGRGKAGGVALCRHAAEVPERVGQMLGRTIRGHVVRACLVEEAAAGTETYLSLMVDAARGSVRLTFAPQGGVDIEALAQRPDALLAEDCAPDRDAVAVGIDHLAARVPAAMRAAFAATARPLADLFFAKELMLAEINPLFVADGGAVAGDAKVVIDVNAVDRHPDLLQRVRARPAIYPDLRRKLDEGFDFIEVDADGEIGLLTTGAGLSMMLIDELVARGARPINFCDIRTGQLRGSPARVARVLEWLAAAPNLKVVFVNVFAGITDLAEFADLLVRALAATPALTVPVVARLVGNGEAPATALLRGQRPDIAVYSDLEAALARVAKAGA